LSATGDSNNKYDGKCTICEIADPIGNGQCLDQFENDGSEVSCKNRCVRPGATEDGRKNIIINGNVDDFERWSSLENMVGGGEKEITNTGFCGFVAYDSDDKKFRYETIGKKYWDICEQGWSTTLDTNNLYGYTADANREIANDKCAARRCQESRTDYLAYIRSLNLPSDTNFENVRANRCVVDVKEDGEICSGLVTLTSDLSKRYNLVGKCSNGQCLYQQGNSCPSGYITGSPESIQLNDCSSSKTGRNFATTFHSNQANDATGNFKKIPHADNVICHSHAHKDNEQWPIKFENGTEGASTGGTANMSYAGEINGPVTERFNWMIFSQYYSWPLYNNSNVTVTFKPEGTTQTRTGLGIACDPNMDDDLKDDYGCYIRDTGLYKYLGADIAIWENSNRTTRSYQITIKPVTFTFYNVFICPGVSTNRCLGGFECEYFVGKTLTDAKELCTGKYMNCIPTPTMFPTKPPTMNPTTTSTAHGDPIIWTFNDECYDLNKDGLYDATVNPRFDHFVKIGVYNDFMRELQVVHNNGEVLLSINSLGEYEKSNNFLYRFKFEEKDCPVQMKETECVGTYKEWKFDVQEFEYTVHLLRHNYKDEGIPEGDLGYHLDIYPRAYKSFKRPGVIDTYSGLFFENPLPEELEYCPGGSHRNKGDKQAQSRRREHLFSHKLRIYFHTTHVSAIMR